jgi:hypothetical protein
MTNVDLAKRDMTIAYGERHFALRAYRDDGLWHGIIIENKTPLRAELAPMADAAHCFAAAVQIVAAMVDANGKVPVMKR